MLRKKPLESFAIEDFRIMIGQGISLKVLGPRALDLVGTDPLAEGDFSPGDLLSAMCRNSEWLADHSDMREWLFGIARRAEAVAAESGEQLK